MTLSKREQMIVLALTAVLFAILAGFVGIDRVWDFLSPLYTLNR